MLRFGDVLSLFAFLCLIVGQLLLIFIKFGLVGTADGIMHIFDEGTQCFPLYVYAKEETDQLNLFDKGDGGYRRESGITDFMLER